MRINEVSDEDLKAFDPKTTRALNMLKTKYPQADNILSALLADVENKDQESDVADMAQDLKMDKLTKAVDILQKEINLLKGDKKLNAVKEEALNEFTISDLKHMGVTHITPEQKKELQKISHENDGNITRSDLKKVGLLLQTRHIREETECPACNGTGWERVSSDEDERGCDECGGTGEINEDAMSAEEIGKYPDLGWTNVNDTQEVKTYLNNMPHTPRVKIEAFRQRVTEPHFQKFLKKYMTDHPDEPSDLDLKAVDSKPVTTNAPVKGHHNEDAVNEESGISKFNKEDPNNPEVMIQGYGSLLLSQIENDIVRNFNALANMAEKKDWRGIDYQLNKTGVMQAKIEAIITTKEQLQAIRRKGGPKSRGIANEGEMKKDKKNPHAQPYLDTQEWKDLHFMGDEIISAYIKHKQKLRVAGQAIGRAIVGEGDIEADKINSIAIPYIDNPWWKKLHDMDDEIISAYVKHKSLKRAVGRGLKKGYDKLSRLGSKNTSSKFDGKGHVSTTTTYNESKESRTSLYDALTEDDGMNEGIFDKLKVASHKNNYVHAAESLHKMLQRKYKENEGHWRHALGWYVAKIAGGFKSVDSKILQKFYLENYKSAFITETGGVGRVVPGVNTSIDVGPGEIKKQAAKFSNVVDKDGVPKKTFR